METIKVNMTPCEDIKTIHASQNDNEGREWGFELHNNGEKIDSSSISDQMVFKAYKGGTEQILPVNGSTPTTSPFKGDIRYPHGLLTDQEFTYRQSPTEEDGLAKITEIKGNTLVWNQLAEPLESGNYLPNGGTLTFSNGVATFTATSVSSSRGIYQRPAYRPSVNGHKYLLSALITSGNSDILKFGFIDAPYQTIAQNTKQRITKIVTSPSDGTALVLYFNISDIDTFSVENIMMIDLTQMGLDISSPSEFTSLFPLPYYSYNQGSLLSFMGNGIKTVGKNQLDPSDAVGLIGTVAYSNDTYTITYSSSGDRYVGMNFYRRGIPLDKLLPKKYTLSFDISGISTTWAIGLRNATNNSFLNSAALSANSDGHYSLTIDLETNNQTEYYLSFVRTGNQTSALTVLVSNVMLEIGNTETSYQPYTSSTLSLPISTYFPTGMKSAYNSSSLTDIVRDELSQTKAIKKVKQITFDGSSDENWSIENINSGSASGQHNFYTNVAPAKKLSSVMNNMAVPYALHTANYIDGKINAYVSNGQNLNFYPGTDITSVADFRTWLSNHPLTVNIALPTDSYEETSFTTASLVTENAEIPLSNNDGVLIGKCTEELSAEPGFHDAKIKLSDSDGTCYSNKIQLHIERSPQ